MATKLKGFAPLPLEIESGQWQWRILFGRKFTAKIK